MVFAYLDKYGILHANPVKATAEAHAKFNGKVVETELPEDGGYIETSEGKTVFAYADEKKVLIGGNTEGNGGVVTKFEDLTPAIQDLLTAVGF